MPKARMPDEVERMATIQEDVKDMPLPQEPKDLLAQEAEQIALPTTLQDVDFAAIEAVIDQDPRNLTDEQLNMIVAHARAHRLAWMEEEKNPTGQGGGKRRKLKIDLDAVLSDDDLDLGL